MNRNDEEIITIEELCEILRIGKNTANMLLGSGQIAAFRIGRLWKIPKNSVYEYINNSTLNTKPSRL